MEELVLAAATVLCWRGFVEPDEHDRLDDELLEELALVARAHPHATTPDAVADHWVCERQEAWERSVPTWTCDCGATFKMVPGLETGNRLVYRVGEGGLLGEYVGTLRGAGMGPRSRNRKCPGCGREFARTIAHQADPQLVLFV